MAAEITEGSEKGSGAELFPQSAVLPVRQSYEITNAGSADE